MSRARNWLILNGLFFAALTQVAISYANLLDGDANRYLDAAHELIGSHGRNLLPDTIGSSLELNTDAGAAAHHAQWLLHLTWWMLGVVAVSCALAALAMFLEKKLELRPDVDHLLGGLRRMEGQLQLTRQERELLVSERERYEQLLSLNRGQLAAVRASVDPRKPWRRRLDTLGLYVGVFAGLPAIALLLAQAIKLSHHVH